MDELEKKLEFTLGVYNSKIKCNNQTTVSDYLEKMSIYKDYLKEIEKILNKKNVGSNLLLKEQLFMDYQLKFKEKHL